MYLFFDPPTQLLKSFLPLLLARPILAGAAEVHKDDILVIGDSAASPSLLASLAHVQEARKITSGRFITTKTRRFHYWSSGEELLSRLQLSRIPRDYDLVLFVVPNSPDQVSAMLNKEYTLLQKALGSPKRLLKQLYIFYDGQAGAAKQVHKALTQALQAHQIALSKEHIICLDTAAQGIGLEELFSSSGGLLSSLSTRSQASSLLSRKTTSRHHQVLHLESSLTKSQQRQEELLEPAWSPPPGLPKAKSSPLFSQEVSTPYPPAHRPSPSPSHAPPPLGKGHVGGLFLAILATLAALVVKLSERPPAQEQETEAAGVSPQEASTSPQ